MFFLDAFLKGLKPQFDDDVVDRMNYYYTPMLLAIFSLTLSAKQYVGQPIQCWIPAQFTGAWEQYSENYCFVQNTYFVPMHEALPDSGEERERLEISYYQWVPFILGLQAILFFLPSFVWRVFNWQSGLAVKSVVNMAQDVNNLDHTRRENAVQTVAAHVVDSLNVNRKLKRSGPFASLVRKGSFLSSLYLFIKLLYLLQVLAQFVLLNNFLGTAYTLWGWDILVDLWNGREWKESGHFPRVTMCDFAVRVLGNKQNHSVQCVLMINMYNEKVYLFIWWWLLAVGVCTVFSLCKWAAHELSGQQAASSFLGTYLRAAGLIDPEQHGDARLVARFGERFLRRDGVFVLRLVSANAGDLVTTDLVAELWRRFLEDEKANYPARSAAVSPSAPSASRPLDDPDGFREMTPEKRPLD